MPRIIARYAPFVLLYAIVFIGAPAYADYCAPAGSGETEESITAKGMTPMKSGSVLYACTFRTTTPTTCRSGETAATTADLPLMKEAGYPDSYVKVGNCWAKSSVDVGAAAGQAKQELNSMWCRSKDSCGGEVATVEDLDGQFAVCIADFIKKYRAKDPSTCIYSAYRTARMQTCKCGSGGTGCLPGGRSNHQKGIAVDVHVRNGSQNPVDYQDIHSEIRNYPGLRYLNISGDPYHIEADNTGKCGVGVAGGNDSPAPIGAMQSAMNAIRSFFSPPPAQPPITTPIAPAYDPTQYFSTTSPPTSSSVSGSIQTSDTNPTSTPQAVSDLIKAIAGDDTSKAATTTATGTSIALIDALGNVSGLKPGVAPTSQGTSTVAVASLTPNNTFTSQDLSKNPAQNILRGNSTFVLLEAMRQTLLRLLAILRPFGGRTSPKGSSVGAAPPQFAE